MHLQISFLLAFIGIILLTSVDAFPTGKVNLNSKHVCTSPGLFEDPASCKHYYHCDHSGKPTVYLCEDGTAWNKHQDMCDSDSYRLCFADKLGISTEKRLQIAKGLIKEPLRFLGHCDDDYFSSTTSSASITLREATIRNTKFIAKPFTKSSFKKSNRILNNAHADGASDELRKRQTSTPTSTPTSTIDPNINDTQPCSIGQVANVPNPNDCSKYTFCENGYGQNFICPTGMKFDYVTANCVTASKAHCYRLPVTAWKWWTHTPNPSSSSV